MSATAVVQTALLLGVYVAFAGAYGFEKDYKSIVVSGTTHHDLYEHNFTLALAYSHNFDSVCDHDNSRAQSPILFQPLATSTGCFKPGTPELTTHALSVDTFEPQLTWTATPLTLVELGGTLLPGSPADFSKLVADDTEKWAKVIRAVNIKAD